MKSILVLVTAILLAFILVINPGGPPSSASTTLSPPSPPDIPALKIMELQLPPTPTSALDMPTPDQGDAHIC